MAPTSAEAESKNAFFAIRPTEERVVGLCWAKFKTQGPEELRRHRIAARLAVVSCLWALNPCRQSQGDFTQDTSYKYYRRHKRCPHVSHLARFLLQTRPSPAAIAPTLPPPSTPSPRSSTAWRERDWREMCDRKRQRDRETER